MLAIYRRDGVNYGNIYEEVFCPIPVLRDYVAWFSFVVESATVLVSGFKTSTVEGFGENAPDFVMA